MPDRPTILVVGDCLLDRSILGRVHRTSPEFPGVPVLLVEHERSAPGGAANVACNVVGLGGKALLVGAVGDDPAGRELADLLARAGVDDSTVTIAHRPTTTKDRVVAGAHLCRIDRERTTPITDARITRAALNLVPSARAVVISDYGKGVCTFELCREVIDLARSLKVPVIVDPKCPDWARYEHADIIKPNRIEADEAARHVRPDFPFSPIPHGLLEYADKLLITHGSEGMTLYGRHRVGPFHVPAEPTLAVDVCGAGDSVSAALAVAIARGDCHEEAVRFASKAGSAAVEREGTFAVTLEAVGAGR